MKLIIFLLSFATAVFSAERFNCRVYKDIDNDGAVYLKAIYIDGVLRGELSYFNEYDTEPRNFVETNRVKESQVSVMTDDMYTIKTVTVPVNEIRYVSSNDSKYHINYTSETFYIHMSKTELKAARFKDDRGDKCLGVWFTSP